MRREYTATVDVPPTRVIWTPQTMTFIPTVRGLDLSQVHDVDRYSGLELHNMIHYVGYSGRTEQLETAPIQVQSLIKGKRSGGTQLQWLSANDYLQEFSFSFLGTERFMQDLARWLKMDPGFLFDLPPAGTAVSLQQQLLQPRTTHSPGQ